jgi:hypothetical protein
MEKICKKKADKRWKIIYSHKATSKTLNETPTTTKVIVSLRNNTIKYNDEVFVLTDDEQFILFIKQLRLNIKNIIFTGGAVHPAPASVTTR